jgi:hypothetical protein
VKNNSTDRDFVERLAAGCEAYFNRGISLKTLIDIVDTIVQEATTMPPLLLQLLETEALELESLYAIGQDEPNVVGRDDFAREVSQIVCRIRNACDAHLRQTKA